MTALYRGGRRAKALAVYHRAHRLLRDQLGTGPDVRCEIYTNRSCATTSRRCRFRAPTEMAL